MNIHKMVVQLGVDPAGVSSGLAKGAAEIERFADRAERGMNRGITVGAQQAIAFLDKLGIKARALGENTEGIHLFETAERDIAAVTGVLDKLGLKARVVAEGVAAVGTNLGTGMRASAADIQNSIRTLEQFARSLDVADAGDVAALKALVAEQRSLMTATAGTAREHERLDGVLQKVEASVRRAQAAERRGANDGIIAIQRRIELLSRGVAIDATKAASVQRLQTIETALQRSLARANLSLEQQITLSRTLASAQSALARATDQTVVAVERTARVTGGLGKATGGLSAVQKRGTSAAIAFGFGLEAVARGGTAAEGGVRTALRAVSSFAGFFGPGGLVVAGLAAGGLAIHEYFSRARDELKKTRETFEEEVAKLVRSADMLGVQKMMQDLLIGDPAAGVGAGGGFKGSIRDLEAQLRAQLAIADAADKAFDAQRYLAARGEIRRLRAELTPLQDQYRKLRAIIENPVTVPTAPRGLNTVTTTAPGNAAQASIDTLVERTQRLVALYRLVDGRASLLPGLAGELAMAHDAVTRALAAQGDQLGRNATALREQLAALDAINSGDLHARARTGQDLLAPNVVDIRPTLQPVVVPPKLVEAETTITRSATFFERTMHRLGEYTDTFGARVRAGASDAGTMLKDGLGGMLAAFGPLAILAALLSKAAEPLIPLFEAFIAPLTAVVQVIAAALAPTLRLLFPIIKFAAIILTYFGEITARVTGALARVIGNVVRAIGRFISKIPGLGGFGRSIARAGDSLLRFADDQSETVREMQRMRRDLRKMEFGDTADSVSRLGDEAERTAEALRNLPEGFRIGLARYEATLPVPAPAPTPTSTPAPTSPAPAPTGGGTSPRKPDWMTRGMQSLALTIQPGAIVVQGSDDPAAVARAVMKELQARSLALFGVETRWAEVQG